MLLRWENFNDLDLIVTDPYGESVWFKNRRVSSGGQLEIDMNVEFPDSKTPIENIYWQSNGAPNGTYNVYLLYYKQHEITEENSFNITVKHGNKKDVYTGTIKDEKEGIHICTFTLGNANNSQNPPHTNPSNPNTPPASNRRKELEQERNRLQNELERVNNELKKIVSGR